MIFEFICFHISFFFFFILLHTFSLRVRFKKKATHAVSSGVCGAWGISVVCLLRCFASNEKIKKTIGKIYKMENNIFDNNRCELIERIHYFFVHRIWQWIFIAKENWALIPSIEIQSVRGARLRLCWDELRMITRHE